jgi:hypothetical protein
MAVALTLACLQFPFYEQLSYQLLRSQTYFQADRVFSFYKFFCVHWYVLFPELHCAQC